MKACNLFDLCWRGVGLYSREGVHTCEHTYRQFAYPYTSVYITTAAHKHLNGITLPLAIQQFRQHAIGTCVTCNLLHARICRQA